MKYKLLIISTLLVLSLASLDYSNPQQKKDVKKAENHLVTFIELGSVRCIPCKKMEPVLEHIRQKYPKDVKVVFHDVWTQEGKPYAAKYNVRSIPTQVFLDKDGKEYFRHVGFFPETDLIKILKQKGAKN